MCGAARFFKMDRKQDFDTTLEFEENTFYHEVGHVLGLIHEHQRYDRGHYIRVYDASGRNLTGPSWDRIFRWRNQRFCFLWCWYSAVRNATTYDTPYDYQSVMHYYSKYSARNPKSPTLPNNGGTWDTFSENKKAWGAHNQCTYFTPWDIYTVKRRYGTWPNPRPTYTPTPAYPPRAGDASCP